MFAIGLACYNVGTILMRKASAGTVSICTQMDICIIFLITIAQESSALSLSYMSFQVEITYGVTNQLEIKSQCIKANDDVQ